MHCLENVKINTSPFLSNCSKPNIHVSLLKGLECFPSQVRSKTISPIYHHRKWRGKKKGQQLGPPPPKPKKTDGAPSKKECFPFLSQWNIFRKLICVCVRAALRLLNKKTEKKPRSLEWGKNSLIFFLKKRGGGTPRVLTFPPEFRQKWKLCYCITIASGGRNVLAPPYDQVNNFHHTR